jgi:hypothetical protein
MRLWRMLAAAVATHPMRANATGDCRDRALRGDRALIISEGPLEARCTRNLEKNRHLVPTLESRAITTHWRRLWRHPRPQTSQARAWRGQRPTAPPSLEKTRLGREIWGHTFPRRGHPFPRRKSISRRGDRTRRPARERQAGRAAGGRAGGEGTRADGRVVGSRNGHRPHPSAGEQAAQAQAQARAPTQRACGRECGPHNAGRMRATQCGTLQTCEQTGRWERTGQVKWTTAPPTTRTRPGHDMATSSDAFGITSYRTVL